MEEMSAQEKRVLVTGASGFIGDFVTKKLVNDGYHVYSIYNNSLPLAGVPMRCNLTSSNSVKNLLEEVSPNAIVHLAAMTDVDMCEVKQENCRQMNTGVTSDICKYSNDAFLVFVSTDYVFDGTSGNYSEMDPPNPQNFYGKSKLEAEQYVLNKANSCILRISTPFAITKRKVLFYQYALQKIMEGKKISVVDDQYVTSTYVPSLSEVISDVLASDIEGIFHIAVDKAVSRYRFMQDLVSTMGLNGDMLSRSSINDVQWKAKRPVNSSMKIQKAESTFRSVNFDYNKSINEYANNLQMQLRK